MTTKIVAIGGGENGRISSSKEQTPYELYEIDKEIVDLTKKEKPNFLFLAHSQIPWGEESEIKYFETKSPITEWDYSPKDCYKRISTKFCG